MRFTPRKMKWALRLYPPFFFQRIWVRQIHRGFRGADVRIRKSLFNVNSNRAIFGGTIFASIDPIYPLLIDSYIRSEGHKKTVAWLKSAHIEYKRPGYHTLQFSVRLNDAEMKDALETIRTDGKVIKTFHTEIHDNDGVVCALVKNEIYIRDLTFNFDTVGDT